MFYVVFQLPNGQFNYQPLCQAANHVISIAYAMHTENYAECHGFIVAPNGELVHEFYPQDPEGRYEKYFRVQYEDLY